jgi:hypothetical protein
VLGVALFGSLIGQRDAFLFDARMELSISVVLGPKGSLGSGVIWFVWAALVEC